MPIDYTKLVNLEDAKVGMNTEHAMIASNYSSSATYAVGAYAYYAGTLYKCTTAITTAEAWNSAHWAEAKLGNDLISQSEKIEAIGSATTIVNPDGNLINPAELVTGYILDYNTGGLSASANITTTGFIKVENGQNVFYSYGATGSRTKTGALTRILVYDADKEYIKSESSADSVFYYRNTSGSTRYIRSSYLTSYTRPLLEYADYYGGNRKADWVPFSLVINDGAVASQYTSTKKYPVGEYVLHDNNLYRSKVAIPTAEQWNSSHWDAVNIGAELSDDIYPFSTKGVSELNALATRKFSAFVIHCADPTATVKLNRLMRAYGNPAVTAVVITVNGTTYNILNLLHSSYAYPNYNTFNISGVINGYFIIDWSSTEDGNNYTNINATLKQEYVQPFEEIPKYNTVEIALPSVINVAVGHQISLEYYNIIRCSDVSEYEIISNQASTVFQNLGDRLKIEPTSAGETSLKLSAYKNSVLVAEKTVTINAVADTQPQIKAIFLGDSMTAQGYYLAELKNMLGSNLTLYGTISTTAVDADDDSQTVLSEGRSSWSTSDYVGSASKGGVSNPFYNNGFDFSYYMTNNPTFNDVTDVFILLGANDGASASYMTNMATICNSIKSFNANIRIHIMLPTPPVRSGYAWGTRTYTNYLTFKNYMFDKAKQLVSTYGNTSGYTIVPVNVNLNCYYDFPQTEVAVNSRNPQLINVANDNIHPAKYGFYRFADVIYGDIIANCQ